MSPIPAVSANANINILSLLNGLRILARKTIAAETNNKRV